MTEKREVKTWEEFRDSGLLFLLNKTLHQIGYAVAFDYDDDDNLTGWFLQGNGQEGWYFTGETEADAEKRLAVFLKQHPHNLDAISKDLDEHRTKVAEKVREFVAAMEAKKDAQLRDVIELLYEAVQEVERPLSKP